MILFGAACTLAGVAAGWLLGYGHRWLIEAGRAYGRLLADISRAARAGRWT